MTQALEAAKTWKTVIVDPREADVGSILGFGFAPFTGGTLSYIDGMGTKAFVALCEKLAREAWRAVPPNKLLERWRRRVRPSTDAWRVRKRRPEEPVAKFTDKDVQFDAGCCKFALLL